MFASNQFLPGVGTFFQFGPRTISFVGIGSVVRILGVLELGIYTRGIQDVRISYGGRFLTLGQQLRTPSTDPIRRRSFSVELFFTLNYFRYATRSTNVDSIFKGSRLSITFTYFDFRAIGFFSRFLYRTFGVFRVFVYPPIKRVSRFIGLEAIIIGNIQGFVYSCNASTTMIFTYNLFRAMRQDLGSNYERSSSIGQQVVMYICLVDQRLPAHPVSQLSMAVGIIHGLGTPRFGNVIGRVLYFIGRVLFMRQVGLVQVTSISTRHVRFSRNFFNYFLTRPIIYFGAFFVGNGRFFGRVLGIYFNVESRVFIHMMGASSLIVTYHYGVVYNFFEFRYFLYAKGHT